jgi:hypothetical protein
VFRRFRRGRRPDPPRWATFEERLADGSISDAVIILAGGDQVSLDARTPVYLGPNDQVTWRERHGWGWSAGVRPPGWAGEDPSGGEPAGQPDGWVGA